jgi:hypothetical protein
MGQSPGKSSAQGHPDQRTLGGLDFPEERGLPPELLSEGLHRVDDALERLIQNGSPARKSSHNFVCM